jgi:hypothetical protein
MKTRFLVAYDYESGGIWASVLAESAEQIRARYPALEIVDPPPFWLTEEKLRKLEDRMTIDIDDEGHPFLKAARAMPNESGA